MPALFFMFFQFLLMQFIVWCKRTNDPNSLWADLPYTARSYAECEQLVEYYEEIWGNHYIYEIHQATRHHKPQGMCQPCYVGDY